jgi:hypothetical protein
MSYISRPEQFIDVIWNILESNEDFQILVRPENRRKPHKTPLGERNQKQVADLPEVIINLGRFRRYNEAGVQTLCPRGIRVLQDQEYSIHVGGKDAQQEIPVKIANLITDLLYDNYKNTIPPFNTSWIVAISEVNAIPTTSNKGIAKGTLRYYITLNVNVRMVISEPNE